MAWFQIDVKRADGERFDDEIQALNEHEARIVIENLDYKLNSIRILRIRSACEAAKKFLMWTIGRGAEYQHRKYMEQNYGIDWDSSDVD